MSSKSFEFLEFETCDSMGFLSTDFLFQLSLFGGIFFNVMVLLSCYQDHDCALSTLSFYARILDCQVVENPGLLFNIL